ncbi:MAG: hypothetical protein M1833_003418 [Piccolia ochrophora]|nr:MAG: hypothetical protein M1833_003418 [Piccolia ochrophora]
MNRMTRDPRWYSDWMIGDGPTERTAQRRREIASELQESLKSGHFDFQTLEEMIQVLDHDGYCREILQAHAHAEGASQLAHVAALKAPWTGQLVSQLADCMFQTIYDSSYYERELQSRALLSALALQRALSVQSYVPEYYQSLRSSIEGRFQDLQWQQSWDGPLSVAKFRKFQCSYLLCASAEYARSFNQAQPVTAAALLRVIDIVFLGGAVALTATTGGGLGTLNSALTTLDRTLRPLWENPDERFQGLFSLQKLTRITISLNVYAKASMNYTASSGAPDVKSHANYSYTQEVARWLLGRISIIFDVYPDFERRISPPKAYREYFLAFISRGLSFDSYFYLYGLLDCATQLTKVLGQDQIPKQFKARMRQIIKNSKDDSFRWKAIEFLLSNAETRDAEATGLADHGAFPVPQLGRELGVIYDCLSEEEGSHQIPRRSSLPLSPPDSLRSPSRLEDHLCPNDWIEPRIPPFEATSKAGLSRVPLKRGPMFHPSQYVSAGLSPDCRSVYFLRERSVRVYSLRNFPAVNESDILFKWKMTCDSVCEEAALSNGLLAVFTKRTLLVFSIPHQSVIGMESLEYDKERYRWDPNCITIHEANDRAWICVGGRVNYNGNFNGSIKIFQVDMTLGRSTLVPYAAQLDKGERDSLVGDFLKMLEFSPDGQRLVCVTNNNRILSWFLSNNARPRQDPFQISKAFAKETKARGITSAVLFHSPSKKPYVLCTTSPSSERSKFEGEWPFLSPVGGSPAIVPPSLEHSLCHLKRPSAVLAGAATVQGDLIALLEEDGTLKLFSLAASSTGGLCSEREPTILDHRLSKQKRVSPTSLRFRTGASDSRTELFAVDTNGHIIKKIFDNELNSTARLANAHVNMN